MSQKSPISRHSMDSCTFQFQNWSPFQLPITMDYLSKPHSMDTCSGSSGSGVHRKQPHNLREAKSNFSSQDFPDISKLTLFENNNGYGKRRRRGSRSLSGRSSERSRTRRCCSAGASVTYATCSDIHVACGGAGTDSSGELFASGGDGNWASDMSEVKSQRRGEGCLGGSEKDALVAVVDSQGNESGYGSEPGYRGDAEFGYEDEVDEEEDDQRQLFWGAKSGGGDMEVVGENTFSEQKTHHRGRRKKQPEWKMVDPLR